MWRAFGGVLAGPVLAFALAACGGPPALVADASSPEAFAASIAAMRERLDPADRTQLDAAIAAGVDAAAAGGKSAAEIVALGREKRIATLKNRVIPKLEEAVAAAREEVDVQKEAAKGSSRLLKGFAIVEPSIRWNTDTIAVLSFQIENKTAEVIREVDFRIVVTVPGSSAAAIDERFTRRLTADATAGDVVSLIVNPDLSRPENSGAAKTKGRDDAKVEVTLIRIAAGDGRVVYDVGAVEIAEEAVEQASRALEDARAELKALEAGGPLRPAS